MNFIISHSIIISLDNFDGLYNNFTYINKLNYYFIWFILLCGRVTEWDCKPYNGLVWINFSEVVNGCVRKKSETIVTEVCAYWAFGNCCLRHTMRFHQETATTVCSVQLQFKRDKHNCDSAGVCCGNQLRNLVHGLQKQLCCT